MAIISTAESVQFTFLLDGEESEDLLVLSFNGREELSRASEFHVQLASRDPALRIRDLLNRRAALRLEASPEPLHFHGVIVEASQHGSVEDWAVLEVKLVPRFWLTSLSVRNDIYLDKSVPQIIETVLLDSGFSADDFRIVAAKDDTRRYPENEYTVQYAESDFNFLSRLMEKSGLFYYFEHGQDGEVLVIADDRDAYVELEKEGGGPYFLQTDVGLEAKEEALTDFQGTARLVPEKVMIKDYNYRSHQVELRKDRAVAAEPAVGIQYEYGDHYKSQDEGDWLTEVRAQELACQQQRFVGAGHVRAFAPGKRFAFRVSETASDPLDGEYLLVRVTHRGNQEEAVFAHLGGGGGSTYTNSIECIPADEQYRAPRATPVPRVTGLITATVDSSGGDYADLDDDGRYAVKMHFDLTDRRNASATKRVRMMQPYGGDGHGMHLPLQMGTEVALFCMDGDPDRPVIAGVLPNPGTTSQVTATNRSQNVIRSVTGNCIVMDDQRGEERFAINATKDYSLTVANDATETITKNRTITVTEGDETHTVTEGKRTTTIKKDETITVQEGGRIVTLDQGSDALTVTAGKKTDKIKGPYEITVESGHFKVKCGGCTLTLFHSGLCKIEATEIHLKADGDVKVEGANINSEAKTSNNTKGSMVVSDGSTVNIVKGGMVQLNP